MVKTLCSNARDAVLSPGLATKIPHAMRCGQKNINNNKMQQQNNLTCNCHVVQFFPTGVMFHKPISPHQILHLETHVLLEIQHIMIVIDLECILHFVN